MAKNLQRAAIYAREGKALRVIDWMMSKANNDKTTKLKAAEFILERIYPVKSEVEHTGGIEININDVQREQIRGNLARLVGCASRN